MKEIMVCSDGTRILGSCEYFVVKEMKLDGEKSFKADENRYHALIVIEDKLDIIGKDFCVNMFAGETAFISAGMGEYLLKGKASVLPTSNPT